MNDIQFSPGDKVMRVGGNTPGVPLIDYPYDRPRFGKVYCVDECFRSGHGGFVITIVGFPVGYDLRGGKAGWPADAFRKVEEIRLCVAALSRVNEGDLVATDSDK